MKYESSTSEQWSSSNGKVIFGIYDAIYWKVVATVSALKWRSVDHEIISTQLIGDCCNKGASHWFGVLHSTQEMQYGKEWIE